MSDRPISHGAADCPPIGATSLVGQGGADWTNSRRQPTSAPRSRCGTDQSALQWPIAPCQPFRSRQDAYRLLVGRLAPIFAIFQFRYLFLRLTIKIILFKKNSAPESASDSKKKWAQPPAVHALVVKSGEAIQKIKKNRIAGSHLRLW